MQIPISRFRQKKYYDTIGCKICFKDIVEFSCGGFGLATGSEYTGFYYSKNDIPFAMEFDGHTALNYAYQVAAEVQKPYL